MFQRISSLSISPWMDSGKVFSPNKQLYAEFISEHEVCQGGPIFGYLKINDDKIISNCSSSFVWSDDSKFIAVPVWDTKRNQLLGLYDVTTGILRHLKSKAKGRFFGFFPYNKPYTVLELSSFSNGIIKGVNSPVYKPIAINVAIEEFY